MPGTLAQVTESHREMRDQQGYKSMEIEMGDNLEKELGSNINCPVQYARLVKVYSSDKAYGTYPVPKALLDICTAWLG